MISSVTALPVSLPEEALPAMSSLATELLHLWNGLVREEPRTTFFSEEVFTCEGVERATGLKLSQVGKAMVVEVDGKCCIALLPGSARLDVAALKLARSAKKATIIPPAQVPDKTGMAVGAVTPLMCLKSPNLPLVIDLGLYDESMINISTGDHRFGLNVDPKTLATHLHAQLASISKSQV